MNALARYLLVFLLGWSGAIWSYSDLIYKSSNTPKVTERTKTTEMQKDRNDLSLPDALKPRPTITSDSLSENTKESPAATNLKNIQTNDK